MTSLVQCPSCRGLLKAGRESCPHCDHRPSALRTTALGFVAAASFVAFSSSGAYGCADYGPCMQPDGNYCGVAETVTDGGPDAGQDGGVDGGDAG
jgi:hypothetical protein